MIEVHVASVQEIEKSDYFFHQCEFRFLGYLREDGSRIFNGRLHLYRLARILEARIVIDTSDFLRYSISHTALQDRCNFLNPLLRDLLQLYLELFEKVGGDVLTTICTENKLPSPHMMVLFAQSRYEGIISVNVVDEDAMSMVTSHLNQLIEMW